MKYFLIITLILLYGCAAEPKFAPQMSRASQATIMMGMLGM